jgi:hypothetical protein
MPTPTNLTSTQQRARPFVERWYFTGMAILMIAVSIAGFLPAIVLGHCQTMRQIENNRDEIIWLQA